MSLYKNIAGLGLVALLGLGNAHADELEVMTGYDDIGDIRGPVEFTECSTQGEGCKTFSYMIISASNTTYTAEATNCGTPLYNNILVLDVNDPEFDYMFATLIAAKVRGEQAKFYVDDWCALDEYKEEVGSLAPVPGSYFNAHISYFYTITGSAGFPQNISRIDTQ